MAIHGAATITRAIKELEDEMGVALFSRNRRGARLSTAGVVFLKYVRKLFAVLEQARRMQERRR